MLERWRTKSQRGLALIIKLSRVVEVVAVFVYKELNCKEKVDLAVWLVHNLTKKSIKTKKNFFSLNSKIKFSLKNR